MRPLILSALTLTSFAGAAVSGKTIYTANCAACHGPNAGGAVGPSLKNAARWSAANFKRAILQSRDDEGKALKPPMPVWGKVGFAGDQGKAPTDAEIKALQAYLKTLSFKK